MKRLSNCLLGLLVGAFFLAIGVWLFDHPNANQYSCERGKCGTIGAAGFGLICMGLICLYMVFRNTFPSKAERQKAAEAAAIREQKVPPLQPYALAPSRNPRYQRIDKFVSMAGVPLESVDYEYQKQKVAEVRRKHGYAPEEESGDTAL